MKKKSLIETNPYLKNAAERKRLIARSVRTSSGVEGIKPKTGTNASIKITRRRDKKVYKNIKSSVRAAS